MPFNVWPLVALANLLTFNFTARFPYFHGGCQVNTVNRSFRRAQLALFAGSGVSISWIKLLSR